MDIFPHIFRNCGGEQQGALCLTTKGIGAASRKRGFAEGFTLAVGRKGGKERTDG